MPLVDGDAGVLPERQQFIVTFVLDQQTYALPIDSFVKIVEISSAMPVAGVNDYIAGAMDMGGRRIPVVSLRSFFGLPETGFKPQTSVLLAEVGGCTVGLIVDRVTAVLNLLLDEGGDRAAINYPGTILRTTQGKALLLDLAHLFSPEQIVMLAHTTELPLQREHVT